MSGTIDLTALKAEIESIGVQVKDKKDAGAPQEEVDVLVASMLEKKKIYAEANGGIGVDGRPVGLSKSEMKKWEKEQKAKAAAAAATADGGNDGDQQPKAENAAKKAAKKAEKAAKKAAHKVGGGTSDGGGNQPQPAAAAAATAAVAPTTKPGETSLPISMAGVDMNVEPLTLVWNPNATNFTERPMVALGVACLTNTDIDLTFLGDRRVGVHPLLGLPPSSPGCDAPKCAGDISAARYLLRRACLSPQNKANVLGDPNLTANAMQDTWINYAVSMQPLSEEQRWTGLAFTLEHALQHRTFLVGHKVSLADLALFAAFGWPCALAERTKVLQYLQSKNCPSAMRWIKTLAANPCLQKATQLAVGVNGSDEAVFEADGGLDELPDGMSLLEGATPGQVVTRFPPEPSGYLHVGHAKACLLNDFYACRYKGRLVFRFDDTNPDKEKGEYEQSIIEDLALLGVKFDVLSYTSDYIGTIQGKVLELIERGLAYMDDTPQEQMKEERAARQDSKHRNMSPAEAKEKFELMCSGSPEGAAWCLRAKIDMKSNNGTLRDPVLYRQNLTPHHRTGTTYKAYPTYDLACPIVDSIEGVTHALRTTEYNDRDEQYQWLQKALGLRRVRIHSFARMNFQYTVLSKRKLTWFVNEGLVTGWDDARFPTVRGVIRRGVNVSALKKYIYSQGASRNVVNMVWHKFWATNAKELDKTAKRFMAIDASNNIKLKVTNAPAASANAFVTAPLHPKDSTIGTRAIRIAQDVLLETGDVDGLEVGERIVLMRWGVIEITKVDLSSGQVEGIEIPDGDFKACKRKLTWITDVPNNPIVVLTEFDHLVTKEKLEDGDKFEDYVNPCTIATTKVIADPGLKSLQKHETIQLERRGYYRVDKEFSSNTDNGTMVLYMIPDGKSKSMGGIVGQLAHH